MPTTSEKPCSAADRLRFLKLTKKQRDGLLQLRYDEAHPRTATFPGAIGRAGTGLVKLGLAVNLGRQVFSGNRRDEQPDAYVHFQLTNEGHKWAESIYKASSERDAS